MHKNPPSKKEKSLMDLVDPQLTHFLTSNSKPKKGKILSKKYRAITKGEAPFLRANKDLSIML